MTAHPEAKTWDAIVVLGAALHAGGRPSALLRGRVAESVRLLQAGAGPVLLLSGGCSNAGPAEAEVMAELAQAAGVRAEQMVLEVQSTTTLENALYTARLLRDRGWTRALVVTDGLHLPRALMAFRAAGVECTGAAVKGGLRRVPISRVPYLLVHEAVALLWYAGLIALGRHRARAQRLR